MLSVSDIFQLDFLDIHSPPPRLWLGVRLLNLGRGSAHMQDPELSSVLAGKLIFLKVAASSLLIPTMGGLDTFF